MAIPIIDIFAGPGGLGEGFSALKEDHTGKQPFKIVLSIEKEYYAHKTLTLRSFFRQFPHSKAPDDYYEFVRGNISIEELFARWPKEATAAKNESWLAELGNGEKAVSDELVDKRIRSALNGVKNWVLIGGPPCQAYSVVGRSRRQEKILDEQKDERVGLYKQYLRILAVHNPAVFVMENVKGLLSAKTEESPVFAKILKDLENPVKAHISGSKLNGYSHKHPGYRIYSMVVEPAGFDKRGRPVYSHRDFVIQAEKYGVPQTRHRVILLGVRNDINFQPEILYAHPEVPISAVLSDLPEIRSTLSKSDDSGKNWAAIIKTVLKKKIINGVDYRVAQEILKQTDKIIEPRQGSGGEFCPRKDAVSPYRSDWYTDPKLKGVCNHSSRGHMDSDLLRYFFLSCFAMVHKRSPKLEDFPEALLPAHNNVKEGIEDKKFADRFRVQLWDSPSKTITSHISKDGHYYIHPDPTQCRSLTVREAARIQTFPDNYYFCGPRTSQFIQVGNAVSPLLANQIAINVFEIFKSIKSKIVHKKQEIQEPING
jgi:DNA (cytosine-5)-methyltransferase 1